MPDPRYAHCPACAGGRPNCPRCDGEGIVEEAKHLPFPDDGVTYCGWATESVIVDGCGEAWPCAHERARIAGRSRA